MSIYQQEEMIADLRGCAAQLGTFTYKTLSSASGWSYDPMERRLRIWEQEGLVERLAEKGPKNQLQMHWLGEPAPPSEMPPVPEGMRRTPTLNMWTAARKLRTFTPTDIHAHACVGDLIFGIAEVQRYLTSLSAAGYLRVIRPAKPPAVEARYRLVRATGVRPPKITRVAAIVDPNDGQVHVLEGGK